MASKASDKGPIIPMTTMALDYQEALAAAEVLTSTAIRVKATIGELEGVLDTLGIREAIRNALEEETS